MVSISVLETLSIVLRFFLLKLEQDINNFYRKLKKKIQQALNKYIYNNINHQLLISTE